MYQWWRRYWAVQSSLRKSKYRAGLDREASDFRRAIGTLASHLSDVSTESAK